MAASDQHESEMNERLLRNVKKEVKQLMEESVTRKFVHEESSTVTSLCSAVETCLLHGLRKRSLGLFKNTHTTMALLQKVGKTFEPAAITLRCVAEVEKNAENSRRSGDSGSPGQSSRKAGCKFLWIKLALFEKHLVKIVEHLVDNSSKYYEKDALLSDPVDGMILASLLVGPCALEYTRMKTPDHYWTDPPADELVQRHRIHSSGTPHYIPANSESPRRPALQSYKTSMSSCDELQRQSSVLSVKDYVESLHQNSKSTLLYGKNNVIVQPKDDVEPLAGYLSLHQSAAGMSLKWTPNQLMNGGAADEDDSSIDRRPVYAKYAFGRGQCTSRTCLYWDYALTINMDQIVYLHCHQKPSTGGTVVLVGQDGVQRPPIHFPKGGHLLAFLSCLENGLLPRGQLDPPLWSQRDKGKVFTKSKRKPGPVAMLSSLMSSVVEEMTSSPASSQSSVTSLDDMVAPGDDESDTTDYVFRIVYTPRPDYVVPEMLDSKARVRTDDGGAPFQWMSVPSVKEVAIQPATTDVFLQPAPRAEKHTDTVLSTSVAMKQLCDTMKWQILSRAFYGWLSHCRHLKTVRTHLSGLVHSLAVSMVSPTDAVGGLTADVWEQMKETGIASQEAELYRLVYYGSCDPSIRTEVWPYLLGVYALDSTADDRRTWDEDAQDCYKKLVSQWQAAKFLAAKREQETTVLDLPAPKLFAPESHNHAAKMALFRKDSTLSNDVFESLEAPVFGTNGDETCRPETVVEESSTLNSPASESAVGSKDRASGSEMECSGVIESLPIKAEPMAVTGVRLSDRSPDEGLGSSIAAPLGSLRSSLSRRIESNDTDRSVDIIESSEADRATDIIEGGDADLGADVTVDIATTTNSTKEPDANILPDTEADCRPVDVNDDGLVSQMSAVTAANNSEYSAELLDTLALNIHRIDKDVHRCDRTYPYFTPANLEKLRNVMYTYVWENLDVGYIQGMCDLLAPLLVIFDDEVKTYSCFRQLMKRMSSNFPQGGAMDQHFGNMRSLIQILDPELFEHMRQNGDYTHFYFCYRWFLLDFKRELVYDDVFIVWETIWAAKHVSSPHFVLFIALALVEYYREIIIDNSMDFTDIIKFFNEMAERHDAKAVLQIARGLVHRLQDMIENK